MNGDASNRLSVTRSFRHDLADAVGSPGAGVVYLRGVYLRPQSPHLGLAHVPTNISPENLHFQWLLRNKPARNEISRTPSPPSRRDLLRRLAPCFSFPSTSSSLPLPGPVSPVFSFSCSLSSSMKPKIEAGNQAEFASPLRNLESRSRDLIVVANGVSLEESSDFLAFASSRETSMGRRGERGNPTIAIISPLTRQFTRVFVKRLNLLSSDYLSR